MKKLVIIPALLVAGAAFAEDLHQEKYNYLSASYVTGESNSDTPSLDGLDVDGFNLKASYSPVELMHVGLSYGAVEDDNKNEEDQFKLTVGAHVSPSDLASIYGQVSYIDGSQDSTSSFTIGNQVFSSSSSSNYDGYEIEAGVRIFPIDQLELAAAFLRQDVEFDGSSADLDPQNGYNLFGGFQVADNLLLGVGYTDLDEAAALVDLTGRFTF